jgi:hypothetical protein
MTIKSYKKQAVKFNDNTSIGEIRKYCLENNKIFEIKETGFMIYDFIENPEKDKDIIALGNIRNVHIKNQGKKKFSDFGKRVKKSKDIIRKTQVYNFIAAINKIVESGYISNSWGEKFEFIKLSNGRIIVYNHNKDKTVKFIYDTNGKRNDIDV